VGKQEVNQLVSGIAFTAEVYRPPGRMHRQVRCLAGAAYNRPVGINTEAGHTKQVATVIFKNGCALSRLRVRSVFIPRVRPYGHLRPKIGGTCSPFLGRIELPTLYPTIVPKIPVPADWSILPIAIRTVMQTIATSTMSAFGGLVMFTRCLNQRRTAAGILSLNGSLCQYLKTPPKSHKSLATLTCRLCKPLLLKQCC